MIDQTRYLAALYAEQTRIRVQAGPLFSERRRRQLAAIEREIQRVIAEKNRADCLRREGPPRTIGPMSPIASDR